jgi:hypothetical protein
LALSKIIYPDTEILIGWLNMPVWKCKRCGCLWRDNLDDTVSLLNAAQKSCASCELSTTEACAIYWLQMELAEIKTEAQEVSHAA